MATDLTHELQQLHQFIGKLLESGSKMSVAEAVEGFQQYQAELEQLRESLRQSHERMQRGEGAPVDFDSFQREMCEEWDRRQHGDAR